jgi:hypothetical protein
MDYMDYLHLYGLFYHQMDYMDYYHGLFSATWIFHVSGLPCSIAPSTSTKTSWLRKGGGQSPDVVLVTMGRGLARSAWCQRCQRQEIAELNPIPSLKLMSSPVQMSPLGYCWLLFDEFDEM